MTAETERTGFARLEQLRPTRGLVVLVSGALLLAVSLAFPWISIPGYELSRDEMVRQGLTIPATGAAWNALPLTAVLLAVLSLIGLATAILTVAGHRLRPWAAGATAVLGIAVLPLLVDRLFTGREQEYWTAAGMGGYLGLIAVALLVIGAVALVLEARRGPAPAGDPSPAAPSAHAADPATLTASPAVIAVSGAAIVIAYIATRWVVAGGLPPFLDEAIYATYTDQAAASTDKLFVVLEIAQGPFTTWLSVIWVKLGFSSLTAVRLVSVAAGLLTVAAVGQLARLLWGNVAGLVAAGLCVLLPFFLVHDGIGIYEPLVTLIMAAALLLQVAFARKPDLRIAVLLGAVVAAGLLTKLNALPALLLMPLSLLCFDWSREDLRRRLKRWGVGVGIVLVMAAGAYLLMRTSSYWDERELAVKNVLLWPARTLDTVLDAPFGNIDTNWDAYWSALSGYVTIPLLATTLAGAVLLLRRDPRLAVLLLAWILVPFLIGMMFQLRPYPRHAMFIVPPAILLSAYAMVRAALFARQRLPARAALATCAVAGVLLLVPALVLDARVLAHPDTARYPGLDYWQYVAGWPAGGPWDKTADLIESRASGDPVVIATPRGRYTVLAEILGDRYVFVPIDSPLAARARFGVYDDEGFRGRRNTFAPLMADRGFVRTGKFTRPSGPCSGPREDRCGGSVTVYEPR